MADTPTPGTEAPEMPKPESERGNENSRSRNKGQQGREKSGGRGKPSGDDVMTRRGPVGKKEMQQHVQQRRSANPAESKMAKEPVDVLDTSRAVVTEGSVPNEDGETAFVQDIVALRRAERRAGEPETTEVIAPVLTQDDDQILGTDGEYGNQIQHQTPFVRFAQEARVDAQMELQERREADTGEDGRNPDMKLD